MRIAIALALAAATLSHALVGDWTSFTHLQVIRDLETFRNDLFAATTGGIRRIDPKGAEKVYRNTEGLRDVGISALAASPEGDLYATSELGYVYRYDPGADDWDILGTSYRGSGWKMNKRALLYRAGYLVLGSEKGLSFFNVKRKVAEANISKMESANGLSVNAVLFVGDTLFAGTNHGIFKAVLHLDKLLTDPQANIFNPGIWSRVARTDGVLFFNPAMNGEDTAYTRDSTEDLAAIEANKPATVDDAALYSHGFLYYGPDGIASEYEGASWPERDAKVSAYGSVTMDGQAVAVSPRLESIAYWAEKWYVGNLNGLYEFNPATGIFSEIVNRERIPDASVTAIRSGRDGVYAYAPPLLFKSEGKTWNQVPDLYIWNDFNDAKRRGQHAMDVLGPDRIYIGTWGFGFHVYRDGRQKDFNSQNTCLASADAVNPNYPVIWSESPYKDKGIWMTVFRPGKPYHLAYFDHSSEKVSCFEPEAKDFEPRNLQVVGDSVVAVVTERGVEAFRIEDHGGSVTLDPPNLLAGLVSPGEPTLAGKGDRFGNFWVTTEGSHLLYIPAVVYSASKVQSVRSLDGFTGSGCMNLESDPQGHLWAGCGEGGVYEIVPGRDSLAHTFRHYGLNDGLLSETIFHLDVNQDNGDVWVATEKGLARFESPSRPTRPNLSSLKVYPNPFLSKHAEVVFSNLSPGSEIQVATQSGSVVYHRSLAAGAGDQIRWDGRNQAGQRVREGVYFYVVRSPKETRNGKIIVAR
ncbi:MAG TPA: T9SS type A sorting domain-containing protein [Fibrobacteria bacterium]|nr:T9SS type A sorting domain-containing protein [Fibrobacteria bacterium]